MREKIVIAQRGSRSKFIEVFHGSGRRILDRFWPHSCF